MEVLKPEKVALPFEVEKIYKTKFQTGESFLIKEIIWRKTKSPDEEQKILNFKGIYQSHPHLGICPLDGDRLIPEYTTVMKPIEVCGHCKREF